MELLTGVLVGCLVGLATGMIPGLHVNTLAAVAVTSQLTPATALMLVAIGTVHTIVNILPTTYLGVPAEDTALAGLPAHRMVLDGRGPEAVRISVHASLLALLAAVALLLPYKWLLGEPVRLASMLDSLTPWLIAAVLLLLWMQERRLVVLAVQALAGALGAISLDWPVSGWVDAPASPLLPLLTGLFAVPTLLAATKNARLPWQSPPSRGAVRQTGAVFRGVTVAAFTAVMPGLTAAVATTIAQPVRARDERTVLAILSAVNTAHLVFAVAVLWILARTRSGLAAAIAPLAGSVWDGPIPLAMWQVVTTMVAAGLLGALGTRALEPLLRRAVGRISAPALAWLGVTLVVSLVVVLTGIWGVVLLVAATLVGQVPLVYGTRRVHLAAVLLIPILLRIWL